MEKRFVLFIALSVAIMLGWFSLMAVFAPPRPQLAQRQAQDDGDVRNDPAQDDLAQNGGPQGDDDSEDIPPRQGDDDNDDAQQAPPPQPPAATIALQRRALGSLDRHTGFRLLVTTINRGAAIERVELSSPRYRDLEDKSGYLGHLALTDAPLEAGCQVNTVGPGTPAALAGLQVGDVIKKIDGQPIPDAADLKKRLAQTKPGDTVTLTVARTVEINPGNPRSVTRQCQATLTRRPLEVIRPEPHYEPGVVDNLQLRHPMSCLLTLRGPTGQRSQQLDDFLRYGNWAVVSDEDDTSRVEFQIDVSPQLTRQIGQPSALRIIKRYLLDPAPPGELDNEHYKAYHVGIEIEIHNAGQATDEAPPKVAYQLDGPNGLPDEGWWYGNKIHPTKFSGAGARDVVWKSAGQGHSLKGGPKIFKDATGKAQYTTLFTKDDPAQFSDEVRSVTYIGVDSFYFSAVLIPGDGNGQSPYVFDRAIAAPVVKPDKQRGGKNVRRTNVSFQLTSPVQVISPERPLRQRYVLYVGPKQHELLAHYDLDECITYGWFSWVAKPLVAILHFFHAIVGNYGLSIILLTVLVRGLMFPLSRKAAKNMMATQALAPEMKQIKEQYKSDMEKQGKAMRELYRKHKFNPLSGCWMMFVQLPIFLGLYRGLSTDIALRGQPLIPGLSWCSNLVAPDQLFFWKPHIWAFFADEATGWLGPYLNVLPLITIGLFLLQQKMFTPPATDEQSRQQQKIMKYMMLFMGVLFFKVAAGLCIYFITSSLWGIAERKLLRNPVAVDKSQTVSSKKTAPRPGSNGSSRQAKRKKKQKQKRK